MTRRAWLRAAAFGSLAATLGARPWYRAWGAPCDGLAGRTIAWIVPNAAGGGYDAYARLIAPRLGRTLGARVAVRNVPGAGGLVGARTLIDAPRDGRTIGIVNASGLLSASLAGDPGAPNPGTDFTVLARIVGSRQVWAAGAGSPLRSIDDVFAAARERPIVFGTRDVGSIGFVNMTLTSKVLGIPIEVVAGYEGSGAGSLATARGEVDLVAYTFDSIVGHVDAGDVRPVLQIASERLSPSPSLDGVPLLGGPGGVAERRARELGLPVETALEDAQAVIDLVGAGRLVVGPPGLPDPIASCLEAALLETLEDPAFREEASRARLSLDVAGGAEARRQLASVARRAHKFVPVLERAVRKLRG